MSTSQRGPGLPLINRALMEAMARIGILAWRWGAVGIVLPGFSVPIAFRSPGIYRLDVEPPVAADRLLVLRERDRATVSDLIAIHLTWFKA